MKSFFTLLTFIAIPFVLLIMLLMVTFPLLMQHFFSPKHSDEDVVYPYLTSWEEAA